MNANYQTVLIRDLERRREEPSVCVTGVVVGKWNRRDGGFGISLKDLTGTVTVSFGSNQKQFSKESFIKGKRIRINGRVLQDLKEQVYIGKVDNVEFLEEIDQLNKELDILEQESLVMLSKICGRIRMLLEKSGFIEINTRVISRYLGDEILEPLLAEYPGFGTDAYLVSSPSSQLSEFLAVTLLPKVFTETISFTTSYRFPNGSTETPIIMAKAINLPEDEERDIILRIAHSIVDSLSDKQFKLNTVRGEWSDDLLVQKGYENGAFTLSRYSANIPMIGRRWNSTVDSITRLEDDKGNLLVESSMESINESTNVTTFTFYPSQYLNWISKAPKRQLLNLWRIYDGGSMYG